MKTDTKEDLNRIEQKIDGLVEKIGSIDVTLAAQHVSLKDHMRRTELLEEVVGPIKTHMNMLQGIVKLLALACTVVTGAEGIMMLMEHFKK